MFLVREVRHYSSQEVGPAVQILSNPRIHKWLIVKPPKYGKFYKARGWTYGEINLSCKLSVKTSKICDEFEFVIQAKI